jgi:hypothetical protein
MRCSDQPHTEARRRTARPLSDGCGQLASRAPSETRNRCTWPGGDERAGCRPGSGNCAHAHGRCLLLAVAEPGAAVDVGVSTELLDNVRLDQQATGLNHLQVLRAHPEGHPRRVGSTEHLPGHRQDLLAHELDGSPRWRPEWRPRGDARRQGVQRRSRDPGAAEPGGRTRCHPRGRRCSRSLQERGRSVSGMEQTVVPGAHRRPCHLTGPNPGQGHGPGPDPKLPRRVRLTDSPVSSTRTSAPRTFGPSACDTPWKNWAIHGRDRRPHAMTLGAHHIWWSTAAYREPRDSPPLHGVHS